MEKYKKGISVYLNDEDRELIKNARMDIYAKENKMVSISEVIKRAIHIAYINGNNPPQSNMENNEESEIVSKEDKQDNKQEGSLWDELSID
ncbi:MAG: hypothetical protein ACFFG0_03945 [Candidatus Thorarchaeota archaeon]